MTATSEQFCKTCSEKHFAQVSGTAGECRHQTSLAGMKFCFACAITFKVCRACGAYLKTQEDQE